MGKQKVKPNYRRQLLRLPDLDHCKRVLNSLRSAASRPAYPPADTNTWRCHGRLLFDGDKRETDKPRRLGPAEPIRAPASNRL